MSLHRYQHVSFDLDGTLLDSLQVMRDSWNATAARFCLPQSFAQYKKELGIPFAKIMRAIGVDDESREIEKFYFCQTASRKDEVSLFVGSIEFINYVLELGLAVTIITSKPRKNSEDLLRKFNIQVDMLVCGDDLNVEGKPSKEPIDKIYSELRLRKQDKTLYFGDMLTDILFCVNSGIDYCHCDFGIYGPLPKALVPQHRSIRSWAEAKKIIEGKR